LKLQLFTLRFVVFHLPDPSSYTYNVVAHKVICGVMKDIWEQKVHMYQRSVVSSVNMFEHLSWKLFL